MDKHRDVVHILSEIDLDDIEETVSQPYHNEGAGRPPRSPLGIFKALVVKRLRSLRSDRELYRRLWESETLREICDIEEYARAEIKVREFSYIETVTPLLRVEEEVKEELEIFYQGNPIEQLHLILIKLKNTGNDEIRSEDFEENISIAFNDEANFILRELISISIWFIPIYLFTSNAVFVPFLSRVLRKTFSYAFGIFHILLALNNFSLVLFNNAFLVDMIGFNNILMLFVLLGLMIFVYFVKEEKLNKKRDYVHISEIIFIYYLSWFYSIYICSHYLAIFLGSLYTIFSSLSILL